MSLSHHQQKGFVAFITVIIIGTVLLMAGITTAMLGRTQVVSIGQEDYSQVARQQAMACVEEGIFRLRRNEAYTGGTVPIDEDSECTVTLSGGGTTRQLSATSNVSGFIKTVNVQLDYLSGAGGSTWSVSSWTEADPI